MSYGYNENDDFLLELYIQIVDGKPFEHPIMGDNFRQAFPTVDVNNLPAEFAKFIRVKPPTVGVYEVYEGLSYEWSHGVVTDFHHVRALTPEEKLEKQNGVKAKWAIRPDAYNFTTWVLDETTCRMVPPTPCPVEEGKIFRWSGADNNWKEAPAKPEGQYVFDFAQWAWVPVNG